MRLAGADRAEAILDAIGDAVLGTDAMGIVTYLNPVAERMTGWPRDEAIGRPSGEVFRLVDGTRREWISDPLNTTVRHDRPTTLSEDLVLIRRDGFEFAVEDTVAPIRDAHGRVTGTVVVFHDVGQARAAALKVSHLAQHDFLTDLPNRVLFNDRLGQAISIARRHHRQLAVLFIDCDNFKDVNDALGHAVGDLLLQSVAKRLVASARTSDTVSRIGGDEFVILLSELGRPQDADICARKILKAIAAPHRIGQHDIEVTASIGVALCPADSRHPEQLLKCADTALYEAKAAGGNTYRAYCRPMRARADERQAAEGGLLRALERNEFCLHYQPHVSLVTGRVQGIEALLRWNHPSRGLVSPGEFVPLAEVSGLIVPIGRWVIAEACRQAATWRRDGLRVDSISVNVSAVELRSVNYLQGIVDMLAASPSDAGLLELELTESVFLHDVEAVERSLHALAELGVRLTLDDFGTGSSSLGHLRRFPIGALKIDRTFVRDLAVGSDDRAIVAAIIALGHNLGRTVIAEGVETETQLDLLRNLNCEEGQGYHFCRPLSADGLASFLAGTVADAGAGQSTGERHAAYGKH